MKNFKHLKTFESFLGIFDKDDDKVAKDILSNIDRVTIDYNLGKELNYTGLKIKFQYKDKNGFPIRFEIRKYYGYSPVEYTLVALDEDSLIIKSDYNKKLWNKLEEMIKKQKEKIDKKRIEIKELEEKKKFEELKNSKQDFIGWIKDLYNDTKYIKRYDGDEDVLFIYRDTLKLVDYDGYDITINYKKEKIEITYSYERFDDYERFEGDLTKEELKELNKLKEEEIEKQKQEEKQKTDKKERFLKKFK